MRGTKGRSTICGVMAARSRSRRTGKAAWSTVRALIFTSRRHGVGVYRSDELCRQSIVIGLGCWESGLGGGVMGRLSRIALPGLFGLLLSGTTPTPAGAQVIGIVTGLLGSASVQRSGDGAWNRLHSQRSP